MVPGGICFIVHLELCLCSLNKAAGYKESAERRRETFPSLQELLSILKGKALRDTGIWLRQPVTASSKSLKYIVEITQLQWRAGSKKTSEGIFLEINMSRKL